MDPRFEAFVVAVTRVPTGYQAAFGLDGEMLALAIVSIQCVSFVSGARIFPYEAEATSMSGMRRDDIIWTVVITLIAVTINPILKSIGLLPADVFRSLGVFYPGLPQI